MIKFLVTGDGIAPKRAQGDAGFDFYVPKYSEALVDEINTKSNRKVSLIKSIVDNSEEVKIKLYPHEDVLIPTYVYSQFPSNIALVAKNKSGVATKQKLDVGACVVDSSYQGVIHVHVTNVSSEPQFIEFGKKIVQFVPFLIDDSEPEVFTDLKLEEFFNNKSNRGAGGFGSTGLN